MNTDQRKEKHAVSDSVRSRVLELRRQHTLSQVAEKTGLPLGTVKTICSRSGAFRDNPKHRGLFTLPPVASSESRALAVPAMPEQRKITGDKEVDAILWLQQVVATGQPDLIAKAMEARKRIKTSAKVLEERYSAILRARNPGNPFVTLSAIGFGELEDQAARAISRNVLATEAMARFGSETVIFTNTPAEDFVVSSLKGIKFEKSNGLPELTHEVIEAFSSKSDYMPHTLSDCLFELAYWSDLYQLRNATDRDATGDGLHEEWVRRDFIFWLMARIRPRTTDEARTVMRYMLDENNSAKDRAGADEVFLNLVETR